MLRFAAIGVFPSVSSSCLTWLQATLESESHAYAPGFVGGKKQGVCRYISTNVEPHGAEVGRWEGGNCYFTGQGMGHDNRNGTVDFDDDFELVVPDASKCIIDDTKTIDVAGQPLPDDVAVAGFRSDGTKFGVCLVPDGEGEGSLLPGPLYLNGEHRGKCCWNVHDQEQCRTSNFRVVEAIPVVPPQPAPVPAIEILEPNARIFSVRLSFGPLGDPSTMGLTFETPNNTFEELPQYSPFIWWARSLKDLREPGGNVSVAECHSSVQRSCYTESPVAHYCNMTGLEANTKYFYSIGDSAVGTTQAGHRYSFKTPPAVGQRGPLITTAVAFGDMGLQYSDHTRVMLARMAEKGEMDFMIHNGDISYADSLIHTRSDPGVAPSIYIDWMDIFFANISGCASRVPYMMSPGNHEYPCSYVEYEARAAMMPYAASGSNDMQYYSYTVGQTHIISLSGEQSRLSSIYSTEMRWLEQQLESAAAARDRGDVTFIITHIHYPQTPAGYCSSKMSYCCANGHVGLRSDPEGSESYVSGSDCVDDFMTPVNTYTEDLFVKYGVDIHITAHQHVYERTTPVYRYEAYGNGTEQFPEGNDGSVFVNPAYPININNGNAGNHELQDVWLPKPSWSVGLRTNGDGSGGTTANNYADFGVCRFTMRTGDLDGGRDSLTMEYVTSRDGSVLDRFTLYKDPLVQTKPTLV